MKLAKKFLKRRNNRVSDVAFQGQEVFFTNSSSRSTILASSNVFKDKQRLKKDFGQLQSIKHRLIICVYFWVLLFFSLSIPQKINSKNVRGSSQTWVERIPMSGHRFGVKNRINTMINSRPEARSSIRNICLHFSLLCRALLASTISLGNQYTPRAIN